MATVKIKSGQTLSGIAKANNTSVSNLLKANPSITNPNLIKAGATLNLGGSSSSSSTSTPTGIPLAPKVTSSTTTPTGIPMAPNMSVGKPTAVVNSSTAKKNIVEPAKEVITRTTNYTQSAADRDAAATPDMKFLPGTGKPNPNYKNPVTTPVTQPVEPPMTPEQAQMDEVLGTTEMYSTVTGQKERVAPGTPGYTKTNPNETVKSFRSEADPGAGGITIRKLSDGSYARFNTLSQTYAGGASEQDFNDAKNVQGAKKALEDAKNGLLSKDQQAQVDGIQQQLKNAVEKQEFENANYKGGVINQGFMTGMAGTSIAQGAIFKAVQEGTSSILDLNVKAAAAVAAMKKGFIEDDLELVKSNFDIFNTSQQEIQSSLDKMQEKIAAEKLRDENRADINAQTLNNKYPDLSGNNIIFSTDSQSEINRKLQTSSQYQNEQLKSNALTTAALNKANSSTMNLSEGEIEAAAKQIALMGDPSKILAGYGRGDSPNRQAIMKRYIDGVATGEFQGTGASIIDMKFANNISTQNTLKYLGSLTGQGGRPGNLDELIRVSDSINRTQFPAINSLEFKALEESGDPNVAKYAAVVIEVADQVAKVLQGGGTGGGTSDFKMKQANEMFKKSFTKEQVKAVANELKVLLQNRKDSMIGDNPFLQEYSSHPTVQSQSYETSSSGSSGGGGFAEAW